MLETKELVRQGMDAAHLGGMVHVKRKRNAYRKICELMQCHSVPVPNHVLTGQMVTSHRAPRAVSYYSKLKLLENSSAQIVAARRSAYPFKLLVFPPAIYHGPACQTQSS